MTWLLALTALGACVTPPRPDQVKSPAEVVRGLKTGQWALEDLLQALEDDATLIKSGIIWDALAMGRLDLAFVLHERGAAVVADGLASFVANPGFFAGASQETFRLRFAHALSWCRDCKTGVRQPFKIVELVARNWVPAVKDVLAIGAVPWRRAVVNEMLQETGQAPLNVARSPEARALLLSYGAVAASGEDMREARALHNERVARHVAQVVQDRAEDRQRQEDAAAERSARDKQSWADASAAIDKAGADLRQQRLEEHQRRKDNLRERQEADARRAEAQRQQQEAFAATAERQRAQRIEAERQQLDVAERQRAERETAQRERTAAETRARDEQQRLAAERERAAAATKADDDARRAATERKANEEAAVTKYLNDVLRNTRMSAKACTAEETHVMGSTDWPRPKALSAVDVHFEIFCSGSPHASHRGVVRNWTGDGAGCYGGSQRIMDPACKAADMRVAPVKVTPYQ